MIFSIETANVDIRYGPLGKIQLKAVLRERGRQVRLHVG